MKIMQLQCPNCGAPFTLPDGTNKGYCSSCGTPILVDDGQIYINVNTTKTTIEKHIEEIIDHGKEAESDRGVAVAVCIALIFFFVFIAFAIIMARR